jgi:hypothetical protein
VDPQLWLLRLYLHSVAEEYKESPREANASSVVDPVCRIRGVF